MPDISQPPGRQGGNMAAAPDRFAWSLDLPSEETTLALARDLAPVLSGGDLVTLAGDLGSGKTMFARALIRAITRDEALEVPSPTFTLMQLYDGPRFPIVHADLYRLTHEDELAELGWDEAQDSALVLVEWPDRAGTALQGDRIDIVFEHAGSDTARRAVLTGHGAMAVKLRMASQFGAFLLAGGWHDAERRHIQGDASTRSYARLIRGTQTAILMHAPARTDRTPVRYGKPYSVIAHISQDVRPFVALDRGLAEAGFSTPRILAEDIPNGLLLLEDFGTESVVDDKGPVVSRYMVAIEALAKLHAMDLPRILPVTPTLTHTIPIFDQQAMDIELELLLDWYMPFIGAPPLSQRSRDRFTVLWREALAPLHAGRKTWLLRDYHSPNLMWLADRSGTNRIGILDFQDAMIGSPAYDVASLCMDARIDIAQEDEIQLLAAYVKARRAADPDFDAMEFVRDYAAMGAQRCTKILGIFTRLDRRDHKPAYLQHLPRVRGYLARALEHPDLAGVKEWFDTFVRPAEALA